MIRLQGAGADAGDPASAARSLVLRTARDSDLLPHRLVRHQHLLRAIGFSLFGRADSRGVSQRSRMADRLSMLAIFLARRIGIVGWIAGVYHGQTRERSSIRSKRFGTSDTDRCPCHM